MVRISPHFGVTVNPFPHSGVLPYIGYTIYSSAPVGNQWYYQGTMILGATGQNIHRKRMGLLLDNCNDKWLFLRFIKPCVLVL